eukprot:656961-Prorocentrum_minimum.AAC.4
MKAFIGRVIVALLFMASFYDKYAHEHSCVHSLSVLSRWATLAMYDKFGTDGGNTVKLMSPKVAFAKNQFETFVSEKLGSPVKLPPVEDKHLLMVAMFLEGAGAVLYIFGSSIGASMLVSTLLPWN